MAAVRLRGAIAATVLVVGGAAVAHVAADGQSARAPALTPQGTVHAFVSSYLRPDGRVVRTDQGGDTVSEGQAYVMLMTAAVGDRADFERAWEWTQSHLQQPDGLLSWQWRDGHVVSDQSATDADLGAAAALVIAGQRFDQLQLVDQAQRIANAIVAKEVVATAYGPTLVAGPWAAAPTKYVDPSYLAPAEINELAKAFGGPWPAIGATSTIELQALTSNGDLPSDWAVIGSDSAIHPSAPPGASGQPATFGFDAVRAPIWMASSCSPRLTQAVVTTEPALQRGGGEVNLDLGGSPAHGTKAPIGLLGQAAGQWAAGHQATAWATTARANRGNADHPTYYGSAWLALTVLAFDGQLGGC